MREDSIIFEYLKGGFKTTISPFIPEELEKERTKKIEGERKFIYFMFGFIIIALILMVFFA